MIYGVEENIPITLHHIHHATDGMHVVHHCGGDHPGGYTIQHCKCGLHIIDTEYIVLLAHSLNEITTPVVFTSRCPYSKGWFHVESGRKV